MGVVYGVGGLTIIEAFERGESSMAMATTALATTGLTRGCTGGPSGNGTFDDEEGFTNSGLVDERCRTGLGTSVGLGGGESDIARDTPGCSC